METTKTLTLSVVFDNYKYNETMETSWGFSCLVSGMEKRILFDTGNDGTILLSNMKKLKINPKDIEIVVLSHEHWDHIGGLASLLRENNKVQVYMLDSFPSNIKSEVSAAGAEPILVGGKPQGICKGVFSTGSMGFMVKEQALVIETSEGAVVVTGCAHPGIVKVVERAKEITGSNIKLVIGGFHMSSASWKTIHAVINAFKDLRVEKSAPCHCSGDETRRLFKEAFEDDCIAAGVGTVIEIPLK